MLSIFNALAPLVLIALIGVFLKFMVAKASWVDVLNSIALYALFPALILRGISQIDFSKGSDFKFILINLTLLLFIIALLFFGSKLLNLSKELTNTYVASVFFANIGYLGFPIVTSLIADSEAVVSIHIAIYTLLLFSVVLAILEYSKEGAVDRGLFLNILKNPLMLSVFVSVLLVSLKIELPQVLIRAIDTLADGATPTVLIALGIFLATRLPKVDYRHLVTIVTLKLFVMPTIFLFVYQFYHTKEFAISVLESAMPIAITPFILSNIYPLNKNLIASAIVVSSLLSLVSLPIFIISTGV